jgi:hypothetical protein
MNERRTFLRNASLLPLGVLAPNLTSNHSEDEVVELQSSEAAQASMMPALGKTSPPQEQPFTEYHLLGTADSVGNLLGSGARPKNWKDTKARLSTELRNAAKAEDPIHAWIDTFTPSFDERATAIVLNAVVSVPRTGSAGELRYEAELYDISLRSAAVQLDRCLRYRNEMGGYEISGVSAGIGYLAFLKTKPIQRNLIIQSSSADLEELENSIENRTSNIYAHAHGIGKVFEKFQLLGLRSEADGGAAEADLAEQKNTLRTHLLERQFNIQVDAQLAELTRLLSPGSASNYAERYLRLLAYLTEDLADIYCKLYSVAKGVAQVLQVTNMPVASGMIPVDIPLFIDAATLAAWVQKLVPAKPTDQRQPDVLDAFLLWSRAMIRELNRRSQYESEFTVAIPLNQPAGKRATPILAKADMDTAFAQAKPTGLVSFSLDPSVLPFSTLSNDLRVVGVGLSVERSQDDASPVQYASTFANAAPKPIVGVNQTPQYDVNPPAAQVNSVRAFEGPRLARLNATITSPPQTTPGSTPYQRPAIFLSNVRVQGGDSGDLEPVLSYDPACHNLGPNGKWTIQFDPNTIEYYQSDTAINDSWITGLVLYLRLRGTPA